MRLEGFIGPSYLLDSVNVDAQRCVNLYPEVIQSGKGKGGQVAYLKSTPGLSEAIAVGDGPIRLIHVDAIGRIFVVSGDELYTIDLQGGVWSSTLCGQDGTAGGTAFTFDTSTGFIRAVSAATDGDLGYSDTIFVDGTANYLYLDDLASDTLGKLTAFGYGAVDGADHVTWIDGYYIVNNAGTNEFYVSDLQGYDINSLDFAAAEGADDPIVALHRNNRDLWIFGSRSIEIFVNTGNADFPFERIQGGFMEVGCAAGGSVGKINNTFFWLGRTEDGQGQVYMANGLNPRRVSTHAIEQAIASYDDLTDCWAWTYQSKGHSFYCITFDLQTTWVYDMTTGLWHERCYTNTSTGALEPHRAFTHCFIPSLGMHLVGDFEDNRVYILDDDTYSDDGDAITRLRSSPHISSGNNLIRYHSLWVDMETGVGLVSGQGSDPQVVLQWSDDGGHTWSNENWTSAGGQVGGVGEYKTRVRWRRLGSSRDRIFRIQMTDPVKCNIIDAQFEAQVGAS